MMSNASKLLGLNAASNATTPSGVGAVQAAASHASPVMLARQSRMAQRSWLASSAHVVSKKSPRPSPSMSAVIIILVPDDGGASAQDFCNSACQGAGPGGAGLGGGKRTKVLVVLPMVSGTLRHPTASAATRRSKASERFVPTVGHATDRGRACASVAVTDFSGGAAGSSAATNTLPTRGPMTQEPMGSNAEVGGWCDPRSSRAA